ncbi:hypothetical protein Bhyg_10508 [Pseudolycoriella hygida]|uniref:Uncharacterized protein n=1 Tax=Pseudolycoriella hygida TaxID=35572 RepID=A0A9Q0MTL7_9DIPT|nr:hypothetical protein Bhyg_10508 [Pseudolycoriella hygida]
MCLLDFMHLSSSAPPKPRKSLKEISNRYSSHYMQKYNDVNIIYFNENMSMTSKNNTIKFSSCPIGTFKPSPMNQSFSNRKESIREWGAETVAFDFSSDDRTCVPGASSDSTGTSKNGTDDFSDHDEWFNNFGDNATSGNLDSFCTLCTSSFSFNNCNKCDESTCGSKCHSSDASGYASTNFRDKWSRRGQ